MISGEASHLVIIFSLLFGAKKVAERVEGVGKSTDISVLHVTEAPKSKEKIIIRWDASPEIKDLLENGMIEVQNKEMETLTKILINLQKQIYGANIIAPKVESTTEQKPEGTQNKINPESKKSDKLGTKRK